MPDEIMLQRFIYKLGRGDLSITLSGIEGKS